MRYQILLLMALSSLWTVTDLFSQKYQACCGVEPVEYSHANMDIFIPNVFTPNKDTINDLFFPFLNGNVVEVIDFKILTDVGDTVLFYRPTIVYSLLEEYGWHGNREDGSAYIGPFRYYLKIVNRQGETGEITGRACRLDCDDEAELLKTKDGCLFGDQAGDNNGKADKTKKTKEKKCK